MISKVVSIKKYGLEVRVIDFCVEINRGAG